MSRRWLLSLLGLFLSTFALLALSGPGRIDIIDGQARYEVARSLVEHGDTVIRDPNVWFPVLPGRDGKLYTPYRLPQSILGVPAIWLADSTGPRSEARRHYFFALTSAVVGAVLAVAYAVWFRGRGHGPKAALAWAFAGIVCTPCWYYSTSTFDDILGAACVVLAVVTASRGRSSFVAALIAGLWIGAAVNCKPPLGLFVLPVLAELFNSRRSWRAQFGPIVAVVLGVAAGFAVYKGYEWARYPDVVDHAKIPFSSPVIHLSWTGPFVAFAALIVSPACGLLWYCPTIGLSVSGLARTWHTERVRAAATALACGLFLLSLTPLIFFKGDIGWGPRYLTPAFALLWLYVPAGVTGRPLRAAILLGAGCIVQLLALTADPHRLYIRNGVQPRYLLAQPSLAFDMRLSHLAYRPLEVWEMLTRNEPAEQFSPAPTPTYALPLPDPLIADRTSIGRYEVFAAPRMWWVWQTALAPEDRPVDLHAAVAVFAALAGLGLALQAAGCRREVA